MNTPLKQILGIALMVPALAVGVIAFQGNQNSGHKPDPERIMRPQSNGHHPLGQLFKTLDLTKEQITQLKALSDAVRDQRTKRRDDRENKAQILADALTEEGIDTGRLREQQLSSAQERITVMNGHLAKIIAVLTPQQRIALKRKLEAKAAGEDDALSNLGY